MKTSSRMLAGADMVRAIVRQLETRWRFWIVDLEDGTTEPASRYFENTPRDLRIMLAMLDALDIPDGYTVVLRRSRRRRG